MPDSIRATHSKRNIGLVLVGALLFILVVGGVALNLPGALTGTATQGIVTGPFTIQITQTTLDQTPFDTSPGYSIYIYNLTITDSGTAQLTLGSSYFRLIGPADTSYLKVVAGGVKGYLYAGPMLPGDQTSGQLAYRVPNNERPVKLQYSNPVEAVDESITNLPQPTNWVLQVSSAQATIQGTANSSYVAKASVENAIPSHIENAVGNNFFYSTGTISIKVAVTSTGSGAPSITVNSVSVNHPGFTVASVTPALPKTLAGNGQEVDFVVAIKPPQSSVSVDALILTLLTG